METPCPVCGSDNFRLFLTGNDLNVFLPGKFRLVRCNNCSLIYLNPRPNSAEKLEHFYPNNYDQYTIAPNKMGVLKNLSRNYGLWKRYRAISNCKPDGGNLLDVGCATGDFLGYIQKKPMWKGYGIEINSYASTYAQKEFGVKIIGKTLDDSSLPEESFDVVTMWNVFEHVIDPIRTLKIIYNILKPGGWLVINFPNLDSKHARIFGRYWIGYEIPRHLNLFSVGLFTEQLNQVGFRFDQSKCLYGSFDAFMSSLRFLIHDKYKTHKSLLRLVNLRSH